VAKQEDIEIIKTKRINKNNRYYDKITYKNAEGEQKTVLSVWTNRKTQEQRLKDNKLKALQRENDIKVESQIRKRKSQIAPKSTKYQKKKGFYVTSIRGHLIVRYKNTTPFHFPTKGSTTSIVRARNDTESGMLQELFGDDYEELKHWFNRAKQNKNIYIYGGWTYKRAFSQTGSFNGDSKYLDYYERRFLGNNGIETIDKFREFRDDQPEKTLRLG
jgi:hypothetical protein